jgi:hypothetical protein
VLNHLSYILTRFNTYLKKKVRNKPELVVSSSFFGNHSAINLWKIELEILINKTVKGAASLNFKLNTLPSGGYCNVSSDNGTSLSTVFYIMCQNWTDAELTANGKGNIKAYEFFGNRKTHYS